MILLPSSKTSSITLSSSYSIYSLLIVLSLNLSDTITAAAKSPSPSMLIRKSLSSQGAFITSNVVSKSSKLPFQFPSIHCTKREVHAFHRCEKDVLKNKRTFSTLSATICQQRCSSSHIQCNIYSMSDKFSPISPCRYKTTTSLSSTNNDNNTPTTTKTSSSEDTHELTEQDLYQTFLQQEKEQQPTVLQTINTSMQIFTNYNTPEPLQSTVHLLSVAFNLPWDSGFLDLLNLYEQQQPTQNGESLKNRTLSPKELQTYIKMVYRRIKLEPIQYIIGKWDFYDFVLNIRKPMLCPRPETEELVDYVRQDILEMQREGREEEKKRLRILDVGCGTGAIGIALVKLFPKNVDVVAIDVCEEAVLLSNENAVNVLGETSVLVNDAGEKGAKEGEGANGDGSTYHALLCSAHDFTNNHPSSSSSSSTTTCNDKYQFDFDIIVSNPPYIPSTDMNTLTKDVVGYESLDALCGGEDGMDVIRDIVKRLPEWCSSSSSSSLDCEDANNKKEERDCICWMEVDTTHPKLMEKWLSSSSSSSSSQERVEFVRGQKDLSGLDRFVKLRVSV